MAKKERETTEKQEMSLEEARIWRASRYKEVPRVLNEDQKREAFRIFWAANKSKYEKAKSIEKALWLHLKAIDMDAPENFANGLANFGLKKIK